MSRKDRLRSVLATIEENVQKEDYYAAQQSLKGLFHRYNKKGSTKSLQTMLVNGATLMLKHERVPEGTELALLLLRHYNEMGVAPEASNIEALLAMFSVYPPCISEIDQKHKRNFVKRAVDYTSLPENNDQGSPLLHATFGKHYSELEEFALAEQHFLRSDVPEEYAKVLQAWASKGLESETDLFLARAILQYLCLSNIKDAVALYKIYLKDAPERVTTSPLTHFLEFLLETVLHDAGPLFQMLRRRYETSLSRDPSFNKYLEKIGNLYFGLTPPRAGGMAGMLSGLMSGFMK